MTNMSSPDFSTTKDFSRANKPFTRVPLEIAIPVSVLDGLGILVGASANLLVIVMIVKYRSRMQTMDLLILNLCMSDFLCSVFTQPLLISRVLADSEENPLTKILRRMTMYVFLAAGSSSLFLVTLDRYCSVKFPFMYTSHVNKTRVHVIIGCVWLLSGMVGVSSTINLNISGNIYLAYTSAIFALTISLQILAFRVAKQHADRIRQLQESVSHNYQDSATDANVKRVHHSNMKAVKTIILLFLVYVLTWLPVIAVRVVNSLGSVPREFFRTWFHAFNAFVQIHACVNPFIYAFRTRRIGQQLSRFQTDASRSVRWVATNFVGSVENKIHEGSVTIS